MWTEFRYTKTWQDTHEPHVLTSTNRHYQRDRNGETPRPIRMLTLVPSACYRRIPHRTTGSTSLLRHSVNGIARGRSRDLVNHKDTCVERSPPVQVWLQINYTRHDCSRVTLKTMFHEQTTLSRLTSVLRNKNTDRYKYYQSSCNCCGRYMDEPSLITNSENFDAFLQRIRETNVLEWAINQRPDSAWVCELVTNHRSMCWCDPSSLHQEEHSR